MHALWHYFKVAAQTTQKRSQLRERRKPSKARRAPSIEGLEQRQLLAGSVLSNGVLTLEGTGSNDTLRVWVDGPNVKALVYQHGQPIYKHTQSGAGPDEYPAGLVAMIRMNGNDGTDYMYNQTPIGSTMSGGGGDDQMVGGSAADRMFGDSGRDAMWGMGGDDTLDGGRNDDIMYGREGNDLMLGDRGDDYMGGGSGHDSLEGGTGTDTILGESGNDELIGDTGFANGDADFMDGGSGNDTMWGEGGNDTMHGGSGNDTLLGGDANDSITGGDGADRLEGDIGNDTLDGGDGSGDDDGDLDVLIGGGGQDHFHQYSRTHVNWVPYGYDIINDYTWGQDSIEYHVKPLTIIWRW